MSPVEILCLILLPVSVHLSQVHHRSDVCMVSGALRPRIWQAQLHDHPCLQTGNSDQRTPNLSLIPVLFVNDTTHRFF